MAQVENAHCCNPMVAGSSHVTNQKEKDEKRMYHAVDCIE